MKLTKLILPILVAFFLMPCGACAQYAWQDTVRGSSRADFGRGIAYTAEMQASLSGGKTPLWLNANKYGLSSLDNANGYVRFAALRPLRADSARRWAVGYGVDVALPLNYTSSFVVQQAFVEARWLHGTLAVGSKEYPMELKNQRLSSGSQTLGVNARPVPQVRLALPEYWRLPFAGGWLHLKGHVAYGVMTDDSWQHEFTQKKAKYADQVLYHSKAGYLKVGKPGASLDVELGLEMAELFGGKPYRPDRNGEMVRLPTNTGLKAFWNAFVPGGQDASDGMYKNMEGDILGSWLMRINYEREQWRLSVYADHFFEDHSQMFFLDYNGYGTGAEWNTKKRNCYFMYAFKDIMLGGELNLKHGTWLRNIVVEYLYTKYQSGPYNHDRTQNISDHVSGVDDYYNHGTYTGWQHWGQVMGNPLYRSPIYNTNGNIRVADNRFWALHLGFDGTPARCVGYRVLATYQEGWGTYTEPFARRHHNVSFLAETAYSFRHGWKATAAYGMDFGSRKMLGHNAGVQITLSKSGILR